jgi:hypothetical protein
MSGACACENGCAVHHPTTGGARQRRSGRVVVAGKAHPDFGAHHVVDAVRNRFANGVAGEIARADRSRRASRLPFVSRILEIADQFFPLRVDRDHGLLPLRKPRGRRVDMLECVLAMGIRGSTLALAQRQETVIERMQKMADRRGAGAPLLCLQRRGQLRGL